MLRWEIIQKVIKIWDKLFNYIFLKKKTVFCITYGIIEHYREFYLKKIMFS